MYLSGGWVSAFKRSPWGTFLWTPIHHLFFRHCPIDLKSTQTILASLLTPPQTRYCPFDVEKSAPKHLGKRLHQPPSRALRIYTDHISKRGLGYKLMRIGVIWKRGCGELVSGQDSFIVAPSWAENGHMVPPENLVTQNILHKKLKEKTIMCVVPGCICSTDTFCRKSS